MRLHPLFAAALPLAAACTEPGVSIKAELVRLPEPTAAGSGHEAVRSVPPWTSNVTLTSVRSPVTEISITGPTTSTVLYQCPGATSADCRVELNGPALESLLPTSPVDAQLGTYDQITIGYCKPGDTGWSAVLTGTTVISGITWYTRASTGIGSVGPAEPVSVSYTGCGSGFAIVPPLVVTDTLPITILLRLYFDMRDLAFAARSDATTNNLLLLPGCTGPSATGFICAAYTTIIAVPGTALPTIERYRVNTNVTIGLAFEALTDRFVGGYNRRYYIEDAGFAPGVNPDGHYDVMSSSGSGTYRLASAGGGNDFPAFQRATHSGMVFVLVGGPTPIINIPYTAVQLP